MINKTVFFYDKVLFIFLINRIGIDIFFSKNNTVKIIPH